MNFEYIPCLEVPESGFAAQKKLFEFFSKPRNVQEIILFCLKDEKRLSFGRVFDQNEDRLYASIESEHANHGYASTPLSEVPSSLPSIELLTRNGEDLKQATIDTFLTARNHFLGLQTHMLPTHTIAPATAIQELIIQYAQSHGGIATIELSKMQSGLGSILLIFAPDAIDREDDFDPETECLGWHERALFCIDELEQFCILDAATPGSYYQ